MQTKDTLLIRQSPSMGDRRPSRLDCVQAKDGRSGKGSSFIVFVLLLAAAGGGYWYWTENNERTDNPPRIARGRPLFADTAEKRKLVFHHDAGPSGEYYMPAIMGGGVAVFDFDTDGDLDIYFVNGGPIDESEAGSTNCLFRQDDSGTFVEVAQDSGVDDDGYGMGAAVGDVNNDGFPDLYVTNVGKDQLYLNNGDSTFRNVTDEAGIENSAWATSACFTDIDRDGRLDLYVANYVAHSPTTECPDPTGALDYCGPRVFEGVTDKLFRNVAIDETTKSVRFKDVTVDAGIASQAHAGLGVVAADFDDDGWQDLYVANDQSANLLWMNRGSGEFRDRGILQAAAYDTQGRPQASMGIAIGDVNHDGRWDLFVTHLESETNALYFGHKFGFSERAKHVGLAEPSVPFTGFGTAFVDIEHDGNLDLLVANGRVKRPARDDTKSGTTTDPFWRAYCERNQIFLGKRDAFYQYASIDPFTQIPTVARGLAVGDLDNDGDQDFVVNNLAGPAQLFTNIAKKRGHWLSVRAIEPDLGGRDAYGATVTVVSGSHRWSCLVTAARSYLSSADPRVHFGLGQLTKVDSIEVVWPDGSRERFEGVDADQFLTVEHRRGVPQ